jgi:hypothetical protein
MIDDFLLLQNLKSFMFFVMSANTIISWVYMLKMETTHTSLAQSHINFNWFNHIFSDNDIYIYLCVCVCVYVCMYVYMCVCVCVCVCVCNCIYDCIHSGY